MRHILFFFCFSACATANDWTPDLESEGHPPARQTSYMRSFFSPIIDVVKKAAQNTARWWQYPCGRFINYENQSITHIPSKDFEGEFKHLDIDCRGSELTALTTPETLEFFKQKWHAPRLLTDEEKNKLSPLSIALDLTNTPLTNLPQWFNTQAHLTFHMELNRPVRVQSLYQYPEGDRWTAPIFTYSAAYDLKALTYESLIGAQDLRLEIEEGFAAPAAPARAWGEEAHTNWRQNPEFATIIFLTSQMILAGKTVSVRLLSSEGGWRRYSWTKGQDDIGFFTPDHQNDPLLTALQDRLTEALSSLE